MHDIPSYDKKLMLVNWEMLIHCSCLVLADSQPTAASKLEWDGERRISARGYHYMLQDFCRQVLLKSVFRRTTASLNANPK
jgi:hypothetical protein